MGSSATAQTLALAGPFAVSVGPVVSMLSRPVVLWQALAIALVIVVAWMVSAAVDRVRPGSPSAPDPAGEVAWRRWAMGLRRVVAPIVALVLLGGASRLLGLLYYPHGLVDQAQALAWIWLLYRAATSLLVVRYGEAAKPYLRRLLTPVFILLLIRQGLNAIPWGSDVWETTLSFGGVSFPLGGAVSALLIMYVFFVGAWVIEQVLNRRLPQRIVAEQSTVASIAILVRYAISALGIVIALGALGFDATSLAIVAGGLSVGIGIGLQDIVSNFFSGLILLAERSLRPGDVIELDGRLSTVERISLRATTVRTLNNVEKVIPNAAFTTGEVTTLTKTEPLVRLMLPLGVSYSTDPHQARQLIEDTVANHPQVLIDPEPHLLFRGYGDSSLDFELTAWINQPQQMPRVKSDLYFMLWDVLAENGIEIPYPQRDLHLKGGLEHLPDRRESGDG